ncbi:CAP family protein [Lentzea sp.]|uniref:CAP family protein n=1 Tax=Lentzea sp. TaxID=56099 RepID=UPI002ED2D8F4
MLAVIILLLTTPMSWAFADEPGAAPPVDAVTRTVELINAHRAEHGVAPLFLDSEVTRTAQEWADHLHGKDAFEHRPDNPYGENLFWTGGHRRTIDEVASDAIENWYAESRRYDYAQEMTASHVDLGVMHFTAMVWKSSDRVGIGLTQGENGTYVVVNFAERGNTLDRFVANVLPPVTAARTSP